MVLTEKISSLEKSPTGIRGLDEITYGGLPKGRPTLVCGNAGCGKTVLGMQFLVNGATRFNEPGNRATLPAASGAQEGWFPKIERDGWTGIAFVNISDQAANVTLAAFDDNGNRVAETSLKVDSGVKTVGFVDQVFRDLPTNAPISAFPPIRSFSLSP